MSFQPIDFVGLAAALLDRAHILVPQWLPAGTERNGRWYIGDFDGNEGESANVNLRTGQWIDNGAPDEDVGGDLISLYARIHGMTNGEAARELMAQLGWEVRASARASARPVAQPDRRAHRADPAASEGPPDPSPPDDDLPADAATAPAQRARGERWQSVLPVPRHAPVPTRFVFGYRDKAAGRWVDLEAVRVWEYAFEGQRLGYVARFERTSSKGELVKETLPLTWCRDTQDERGGHRWHWKQWAAPRPLYVPATLLAGDPSTVPVVIVEGEKCALAGHELIGHEFDFVSWPGGCKAWALARWSTLMGRTVYLWPDADAQRQRLTKDERDAGTDPRSKPVLPLAKQPGYQAMVGIGQQLLAEHGCTVFMLPMKAPGERPDGWDLADAVAEGWDAAQVRVFIRSAQPFMAPDDAVRAAAGVSTPSMAAARGGEDTQDDDAVRAWVRHLLTSEKGAVRAVRENVVLALDGRPDKGVPGIPECAGLIAYNEFTNNVEIRRPTPWGSPPGDWGEVDELLMGDWLVREHYMPSMPRTNLEEAVLICARRHSYHPLRQRVEALRGRWDGSDRLDQWLRRTCLEEDEWDVRTPLQQYLTLAGRWFLMAMCARVMTEKKVGPRVVVGPGTKFDFMLILEGPQGWGKSTLAATLGGDYFADTGLNIGDKDTLMNIQGIWIYEWGELENMTKQEVSKVKLFVSSPADRFRATFDKRPAKYPRQVVFVGTTNESHYLTDTTGNRRFWPVRVTRPPDLEWLRENMEQLLAEAVHRVDAGERFWPTREEQKSLFEPQQQSRTVESSLEAGIRAYLYDENQKPGIGLPNGAVLAEIGMSDLLTRVGYTIDKQTDAVVKKAGALMNMLGWTVRRTSSPGRPRVYVRPKTTREAVPSGSDESGTPTQGNNDGGDDDCPF